MRILAVVTARAGSKGFPGKNKAPLAGRSLVRWAWCALDRLRRRRPGIRLHLSTDGADLAAEWPEADRPRRLRPAALAADDTTSLAVLVHELDAATAEGFAADAVLLLQPTTPLIGVEALEELCAAMEAGAPAASAVRPAEHPPEWAFRRDGDILRPAVPVSGSLRRQDLAQAWMPVGVIALSAAEVRARAAGREAAPYHAVPIPAWRGIDIDAPLDLAAAEAALALQPRRTLRIGAREIGEGQPCYVIAEAGVNHNGDLALAERLIDDAAAAGADAVKFQTFRADDLVAADATKAEYQKRDGPQGESQRELLRRLELPDAAWPRLKAHAAARGIAFLSTPFDPRSLDLLLHLGVPALKISSGDLTCLPLLRQARAAGIPMILSTGMADDLEVDAVAQDMGDHPYALLHCVSSYPAPGSDANLRAMRSLALIHGVPTGWSDHTPGIAITAAAAALGASIIEKHLTLDKTMPGPDHAASLEPAELAALVTAVRECAAAAGDGIKRPRPCEADVTRVARKSLAAARDLHAGTVLAAADLGVRRPGDGLSPLRIDAVVGRRLARAVAAGKALREEDLA